MPIFNLIDQMETAPSSMMWVITKQANFLNYIIHYVKDTLTNTRRMGVIFSVSILCCTTMQNEPNGVPHWPWTRHIPWWIRFTVECPYPPTIVFYLSHITSSMSQRWHQTVRLLQTVKVLHSFTQFSYLLFLLFALVSHFTATWTVYLRCQINLYYDGILYSVANKSA